MKTIFAHMKSPIGSLLLLGHKAPDLALHGIYFTDAGHAHAHAHAEIAIPDDAKEDAAAFANVIDQLEAYFLGKRTMFNMVLAPRGTAFQRDVWRALEAIPYGATRTYSDIARSIGKPKAVRAVGAANGQNPLSIVVPCHRVIGKDGTLTGYAGGIENKRALLKLEAAHCA